MSLITVFLVAIALGTDALSMAIGLGLTGIKRKQIILVCLVVAVFHILMPLIGLSIGSLVGKMIGRLAGIIGALVLAFIGVNMIWDAVKPNKDNNESFAKKIMGNADSKFHVMTGFTGILVLAGSVSLDALTVGFGLGTVNVNLWFTVITMGIVAGIMTLGGVYFGSRLGRLLGEKAQLVGGIVLIGIGVKMFFI